MFEQLITPFLTRPLRPLLAEHTNVTPELCFDGKVILIDIPVQEYGLTGRLAAIAFKRCFQLAILRRSGPPGSLRPVFLFADEAQNILSPRDPEYQAVARSAGGVTCLLTQQISSIRQAFGGNRDRAENLVSNLQTKFFCQNSGETAEYASNLIGERWKPISTITVGGNDPSPIRTEGGEGGTHGSVSRSEEKRRWIEAAAFQQLRRGGEANRKQVDAVVFAGGKLFTQGGERQPYKIIAFNQEG